jgi:hypothetical protein
MVNVVVYDWTKFIIGEIMIFAGIAISIFFLLYTIKGIVEHVPTRNLLIRIALSLIGAGIWYVGYQFTKESLKLVPIESPYGPGIVGVLVGLAGTLVYGSLGEKLGLLLGTILFTLGLAAFALSLFKVIVSYLYGVYDPVLEALKYDYAFIFASGAAIALGFQITHYVYSGYPVAFDALLETPYAPVYISVAIVSVMILPYLLYKIYKYFV